LVQRFGGPEYDAYVGTSSGAILALAYASIGIPETRQMLWAIRGDPDIYVSGGTWGSVRAVMGARGGFHDPRPIHAMLRAVHARRRKRGPMAVVGAVALGPGSSIVGRIDDADFPDIVMASSSVAPFFPPQRVRGEMCVDWGVRDFAPIARAMSLGATSIDVYLSKPLQIQPVPGATWTALDAMAREIDIMGHEIMMGDLEAAALRNELVRAGQPWKPGDVEVRVRVIAPEGASYSRLPPARDYLDFSPRHYAALAAVGARVYSLAEAVAARG
jgi:predicted acylesterase/phospholipase RssA